MKIDPLKDVRLKIKRANKHINDLDSGTQAFFQGDIYTIAVDCDAQSGDKLAKIKLTKPVPDDFTLIIGDCLYNLRAALDYLAGATARLKNPDVKKVYFPFANNLQSFQDKRTQRKIDVLPAAARPIIEHLKPYKGGTNLLWAISRIRNDDCHNFLTPIGSAGGLAGAGFLEIKNAKVGLIISGPGRLDEGVIISNLGENGTIRARPGFEQQAYLNVTAEIAFGDVSVVNGKPVITTLCQMRDIVENILRIFEKTLFS